MSFGSDLQERVDRFLAGTYETFTPHDVPLPGDLPMSGARAAKFEAAMLFIDVRQSSKLTETFRLQTAAKMIRAYCDASVRIVHRNRGKVTSFNGDGMLAVFMKGSRRNDAVTSALQCVWFAHKVLRPKFETYFSRNAAARSFVGGFRIGCGIDVGDVFAVRVGIGGTNDIAWVGRPTNTAAKLADKARWPKAIIITGRVYSQLKPTQKRVGGTGASLWSAPEKLTVAGAERTVRRSSYYRSIR